LKELNFIEGQLPKGFKSDFESFLFDEWIHRKLQAEDNWVSFHLLRESTKKSLASIHFHVKDILGQSPYRAPFGSAGFSEKLQPRDLYEFLRNVEDRLYARGVRRIQIKNPPAVYQPSSSVLLEVSLLNLGYHVLRAEINCSLDVNKVSFEKKIQPWERRKLKQNKKAKFIFREIPVTSVAEVYEFILTCRRERGQSLSMTQSEIDRTIDTCPGRFFLFGVFQKAELTAASISVLVSKNILYNFYSAHPRKWDPASPIVLLMSGMYGWCQRQDIGLFDLGTSALEDKPNFGLLDFKLHLGGKASAKLTFAKDLA